MMILRFWQWQRIFGKYGNTYFKEVSMESRVWCTRSRVGVDVGSRSGSGSVGFGDISQEEDW